MKVHDILDLTNPPPGSILGNHAIWLPSIGVKAPFSWGGRLCKRTRPGEATYPPDSVVDEVCIFRALAAQQMAPPIGDMVFFKNIISTYPHGAWYCDPVGLYGFEMADARSLPAGRFSIEAMRKLPIEGSAGAWSDIGVKERENVVNGYLVDVRRSCFDMLRWTGERFALPDGREPVEELRARVHRDCQFPAGERAEAYQDFWLRGTLERGQRRIIERAEAMGFAPEPGQTVLDVGCQSGGFLQYAWQRTGGRGQYVGVDVNESYIDCARALARSYGQNICFRKMDVEAERAAFLDWVRAVFPGGRPNILIAASLEKHLDVFRLIDDVKAKTTLVETNAVAKDSGEGPVPAGEMKLLPEVVKRGGIHVGNSRDRNLRRLYRIDRA